MEMNPNVLAHYSARGEAARLNENKIEQVRTLDLLNRYLPQQPSRILDIGGAHGVYAFPIAERGHEVILVDPVDVHIEQASETNRAALRKLYGIEKGDARKLRFADESADAVLLMGPLYHLLSRKDRVLALREARRVLKPSGVLIATYISKFASLIDGVSDAQLGDPAFVAIVERDLRDGQHRNPTNHPLYFTDAYFHHPDEAVSEAREAGFRETKLVGVEGPIWSLPNLEEQMANPSLREHIMRFLKQIEEDETLLGASAHFMAIARQNP